MSGILGFLKDDSYRAVLCAKLICGIVTLAAIVVLGIAAACYALASSGPQTYGYRTGLLDTYALDPLAPAQSFPGAGWVSDGMGGETSIDLIVPGAGAVIESTSLWPYIFTTIGAIIFGVGLIIEYAIGSASMKSSVVRNYENNNNDLRWLYASLTDAMLFVALAAIAGAVNRYAIAALSFLSLAWNILFFVSAFVNDRRNYKKLGQTNDDGKMTGPRIWWFYLYALIFAVAAFIGFYITYCNMLSNISTSQVPTTFWLLSAIAGGWYVLFYALATVGAGELFGLCGPAAKELAFLVTHGIFVWLLILWPGIEFWVNAASSD